MDLHGRRILVTGASSGIGAATARALDAAGARVALMARSVAALEELAQELTDAHVAPADVTHPDTLGPAIDGAASALGGLDGLVNGAGVAMPSSVRTGDPDTWRAMYEVNVLGLLAATQRTLPHLEDEPLADVVNISSMSGRRVGSAPLGIYAGSKHAVHAVSQGLALELRDTAVRVTLVSPGYVDTPIFDDVDGADQLRENVHTLGLRPAAVADQAVHAMGQPGGVRLVEVAMLSTDQG